MSVYQRSRHITNFHAFATYSVFLSRSTELPSSDEEDRRTVERKKKKKRSRRSDEDEDFEVEPVQASSAKM